MIDFTVITVSFNAADTIQETIDSVLGQEFVSIEYLIIDGASTDDTLDILKKINDPRLHYLSEPDGGLYDAMNKGIKKAKGRYVAIINSDDLYTSFDVLKRVKSKFESSNADIVSGHIYYFDHDIAKRKRFYKSSPLSDKMQFRSGWQPPHPGIFIRNSVYEELGGYYSRFKISSDYEFLFRALFIAQKKFEIIDQFVVGMRLGGESTQNFKSLIVGNKEVLQSWRMHGIKPPFFLIIRKLLNKVLLKWKK